MNRRSSVLNPARDCSAPTWKFTQFSFQVRSGAGWAPSDNPLLRKTRHWDPHELRQKLETETLRVKNATLRCGSVFAPAP